MLPVKLFFDCSFKFFPTLAEVLRRFKYSNLHSKAGNEIAQKLNDLLVYAETGKALKSDLIALAVLSRLESFEKEIKESQRTVLATQKGLSTFKATMTTTKTKARKNVHTGFIYLLC